MIDRNLMINDQYKFISVDIPRTACSARARLFAGVPDHVFMGPDMQAWMNAVFWSDIPKHARALQYRQCAAEKFESYYKYSFVRNPWDRQVSLFSNLCQLKPSLIYPEGKHLDVSFREWIKSDAIKINTRLPMRISGLYKKLPQLHWLVDDNRKIIVDFVGKFENFQHDFLYVVDKIGIRSDILHENKTVHDHYLSYYDEESIDIVYKWMKDDCDTFGYEKPKLSENS